MYRHPRVNVTLWMDAYVKQIYPNWVRGGLGLPDLVDVVGKNGRAPPSHPASKPIVTVDVTEPKVQASKAMREEFMSALFGNVASSASAPLKAIKPAPSVPSKATKPTASAPSKTTKPTASAPSKTTKPAASAPSEAIKPITSLDVVVYNAEPLKAFKPTASINDTIAKAAPSKAAEPPVVMDVTVNTSSLRVRKRKRSLVATVPLVDLSDLKEQEKEERRKVKRSRGAYVVGQMTGRGTETDPYVL